MAPRKAPLKKRKASGANVEEWQRRGLKVQFRLPEGAAKELQRRAEERGTTPNALALIWVFDRLREVR